MTTRRTVLAIAATALTGIALTGAIAAPPSSLQIFVPAAPGGGWDQTGRAIENALRKEGMVSDFRFEHKGGAGGTVGLPVFLSTKKGQGNAIMVGGMVMVGAIIANNSPVKLTDATPIARLTGEAEVIVVPVESPFKTLKDFTDALKADPGKVSIAGGSAGGTDHILAGMVAKAVGVDPRKVAYVAYAGGGPAQAALLGNQVSAGVSGYGEFAEQIKAGKLRAIGISSDKRIPGIDVPTFKEQGVDVELFNWRGVFAAPGISDADRKELIALVEKMAASKTWQDELKTKDWTSILLTGDAFKTYLDQEVIRITGILTDLGLKK
jgi:putative tricarboxylic transport membrane protein